MQIDDVRIHNFRSISDCSFRLNNYSLMIGANNAGKTNVMDALRIFYEKQLKYVADRDKPKFQTGDDECWIEIEFVLSDDELESLKEEYRMPNGRLKVRKYLATNKKVGGKKKIGIFAHTKDGIADEQFYGAKNVQQGKLGNLIYIPAASKLDEHTKLSGPSALRDLLNDILKGLVSTSTAYATLTTQFQVFAKAFKTESTEDQRSLTGLEKEISDGMADWGASFSLDINHVTEADIVKNLVNYKILDSALDDKLDAAQFGQGFQRHLIYLLIKTAARYKSVSPAPKKKDFQPNLTILLFEEPEAFLHPNQQNQLCRSLKEIGSQSGHQVFISSHSPHFVSQNTDDICSIIRIGKESCESCVGQVSSKKLIKIFEDNQKLNEIIVQTAEEDKRLDMEAVKYFLWLDPYRCGLFFAHHVLLVEGTTEKVLLNYLIDNGTIRQDGNSVFVLDCLGKYNIHRFMNLLGALGISHSVLYDFDEGVEVHNKLSQLINDCRNDNTAQIDYFNKDLEGFLEIESPKRNDQKPQHLMLKVTAKTVSPERLDALVEKIEPLIFA